MTQHSVRPLLDFIAGSPSCYHVIANTAAELTAAGYVPLPEGERWTLTPGGRYFVTRNSSSLIAFRVPERLTGGFMMAAAHSDSPAFKLKEHAELRDNGYVRLNTEKYGGMLMATWFDRPLSAAGRLFVRENGVIAEKLVNIDRDLLVIPSVAIHMNRSANDGMKYQANVDTVPLFSGEDPDAAILTMAAEAAGVRPEDVLGQDLFLYCRGRGTVVGATASTSSPPSWTIWPVSGDACRASYPPARAAAFRCCASSTTRRWAPPPNRARPPRSCGISCAASVWRWGWTRRRSRPCCPAASLSPPTTPTPSIPTTRSTPTGATAPA